MFRVELDATGWRVIDDCLNFGPYETRTEAEEVRRALNKLDWKESGVAPAGGLDVADHDGAVVDSLRGGRSIN